MRKQHDDPVLHLYGSPIPVVEESKFPGIIFYGKLSFIPHFKYPIHNQGFRLALEAFRTFPVASLCVEANDPSLYSRREKLSLQFAIRLAANPSNPAHAVTFPPNCVDLYEQKP